MLNLPPIFTPEDLPTFLFFNKELEPGHFSFIYAKRFLDVLRMGTQWVCLEVSECGVVGVELARADTAQAALKRAIGELDQRVRRLETGSHNSAAPRSATPSNYLVA